MTKESAIDILESYITTKVSDEGMFNMPEEDEIIHYEMSFDIPPTILNTYTFGELATFATKDFIKLQYK